VKNPAIRRVAAAFAAVTLGEWVLGTTVAVHAYEAGGALAVGFVGFRFAPAALAGVWATQLADHARYRRVLSATAAARMVATVAAALALAFGLPFALVVGLVWLDAAAGSGYRPAQAALLPSLARTPGELTASAALISNVKTSGQMIGALLGGALVAGAPIEIAVGCAALLYAVSAALTFTQQRQRQLAAPLIGLGGIRAGLVSLRHRPAARVVVAHACLRSLVRGLWLALAVVASLRLLSLGRSGLGILMAAASVGALLALLVTPRLVGSRRMAGWFAFGLVLCGLPVAAISPLHAAGPALALMVVWGLGMAVSDASGQTLLNRIVPGRAIGAVTGVMESGKLLFEGFGSMVAPALVALLGTRSAVLAAGLAVPVIVAASGRRLSRIDHTAIARVDVLELLQGVPFFAPLRLDALEGVAARLKEEDHSLGTEIVRQGDPDAHRWYLVAHGELAVEVDGFVVGRLQRGSQFGERGLLRGVARSATVRALTDVSLYALEREDFLGAIAGMDLVETDGGSGAAAEPLEPAVALGRAPLVHSLGPVALAELVKQSDVHELDAGTEIVVAGESDDRYHVLLSGRAEVLVDGVARRELFPGDAFGEIAVLHRVPRTATVVLLDRAAVVSLDGDALRSAVRTYGGDELAALVG
jgi:CRP-like cAMP-binding protein